MKEKVLDLFKSRQASQFSGGLLEPGNFQREGFWKDEIRLKYSLTPSSNSHKSLSNIGQNVVAQSYRNLTTLVLPRDSISYS